jgi:hypothetical protein
LRMAFLCLPLVAISLFHKSHKEAYNFDNVKVTYDFFLVLFFLLYKLHRVEVV